LSIVVSLLIVASQSAAASFQPHSSQSWERTDKALNCEDNIIRLERLALSALEQISHDKSALIIVARLGDKEPSRQLNQRRLHNVREKLKERGVPAASIIVAEGERGRGYGQVDFYLAGKKIDVLLTERNKDICVECCGRDVKYYPDKDNFLRRRK
jgi:hypothetical protein